MNVRARWTTLDQPRMAAVVAVASVGVLVGSLVLVAVAVVFAVWWMGRGFRVTIDGGGFRPIRMIDLLDNAALDELDAHDQELARVSAQQQARAQERASGY